MNYVDRIAAEIEHQLAPADRPSHRAGDLYRLYALLVLTTGKQTSLENVHDAWSTWMADQDPRHQSLIPFCDLRPEQQEQDRPYLEAVLCVAEQISQRPPASTNV